MAKAKKQQSQLQFVPLSPDSPASQAQPIATRSRAAAVCFSPSPNSKPGGKTKNSLLPTPAASSQTQASSPRAPKMFAKSPSRKTRSSVMASSIKSSPHATPPKPNVNGKILDMFDDSESDGSRDEASANGSPARKSAKVPAPRHEQDGSRSPSLGPTSDESDTDSEIVRPAKKRRLLKKPGTPSNRPPRQDQQDIEEDLSFLRSDSPEAEHRYTPARASAKRNQRLSALEALKRKRQGAQKTAARPRVIVDEDDNDEEEKAESSDGLEIYDAPSHYRSADEQDDSFIVEDDGSDGGDDAQIPIEFKMQLMKTRDLFDYAVEWMCQKRLNPAFAIDDEVYAIAFRRLNDFVKGMGGSKFQSSAWTASFSRALNARPLLDEQRFINNGLHDKCDACNRSGHPPTWKIQFQGQPYQQDTLEEESETDANYSRETKLPSQNVVYYVGKFCMANAHTAHTFAHWRYQLYQWVVEFLEEEGYLDPEKVLERDRWNTRRRQEYANMVTDQMKEVGVTKRLYHDFKSQIETAQKRDHEDYVE